MNAVTSGHPGMGDVNLFRRRLSAEGAKPESNNRWKMGSGHVCIYVCMYVCMVFANIWRFKAPSESKVAPYHSHVNGALLRHEIIGIGCTTMGDAGDVSPPPNPEGDGDNHLQYLAIFSFFQHFLGKKT